MTDGPLFARRDLPADAYPIVFVGYLVSNGREVWRETIEGPGVLRVPPLAVEHGEPVGIRVEFADGQVSVGAMLEP
jgi:hypothetical protein